jgi:hypothetical protein
MICVTSLIVLMLGQTVDEPEFRRLHSLLEPVRGEAWRSIPWKTSMLQARDEALRDRKPLFLWSMNGSPLGCT